MTLPFSHHMDVLITTVLTTHTHSILVFTAKKCSAALTLTERQMFIWHMMCYHVIISCAYHIKLENTLDLNTCHWFSKEIYLIRSCLYSWPMTFSGLFYPAFHRACQTIHVKSGNFKLRNCLYNSHIFKHYINHLFSQKCKHSHTKYRESTLADCLVYIGLYVNSERK